jgi:hypothetical protein
MRNGVMRDGKRAQSVRFPVRQPSQKGGNRNGTVFYLVFERSYEL